MNNRKNIILKYLKNYDFIEIENTDIYKKQKGKTNYYLYVLLNDNDLIFYTQSETKARVIKTSFDKYNYNKLSIKEFNILLQMFINFLSFFEK